MLYFTQIIITKEYLHLEPIGLVFVFFFAFIIVIQFTAMLFHRFGTLSHILASTDLNLYCNKKVSHLYLKTFVFFSFDFVHYTPIDNNNRRSADRLKSWPTTVYWTSKRSSSWSISNVCGASTATTTTNQVPAATTWAVGGQFTTWKNSGRRRGRSARWTWLSARDSCRWKWERTKTNRKVPRIVGLYSLPCNIQTRVSGLFVSFQLLFGWSTTFNSSRFPANLFGASIYLSLYLFFSRDVRESLGLPDGFRPLIAFSIMLRCNYSSWHRTRLIAVALWHSIWILFLWLGLVHTHSLFNGPAYFFVSETAFRMLRGIFFRLYNPCLTTI